MQSWKNYPINQKELSIHLQKVIGSGLFLFDSDQKPIGIFKLRTPQKWLCKRKSKIIPNIPELNLRVMARELNRIICCFKNDIPPSKFGGYDVDFKQDIDDFKSRTVKYFEDNLLHKNELETELTKLFNKAGRVLKKKYEYEWYPDMKKSSQKNKWFYNLIAPLYGTFNKYLNVKNNKNTITQTDTFHYIAHLLIACGIEKSDAQRGHQPAFDKIKQYNYRHSNYLK